MDVNKITSLQELKAAAYDQMVLLEQVQRNLAVITARIAELSGDETASSTPKLAKQ